MTATATPEFDSLYQTHLMHLKLKGLQPKTIDASARPPQQPPDQLVQVFHPHDRRKIPAPGFIIWQGHPF